MTDDSIPGQVAKQLKQIVTETVEGVVEGAARVSHDVVISGAELVGDIKPMNAGEYNQKKIDDEKIKQQQINNLKQQIGQGRNVGAEIEQIHQEKEKEEEEKEKQMLEEIRIKREQERQEMEMMAADMGVSTNPAKQKKARGSAFVQGKKKSNQPDQSQMSQTSEFKGKVD